MTQSSFRRVAAAAFAASLMLSAAAQGAATGTITLQGNIAASCNITVNSQAGFNTLDFTANQTNLTVAAVNEQCNDPRGYTVSMQTANGTAGGLFKGAVAGNTDTVAYTVTYNAAAATFAASTATVTNVAAKTAAGGVNKNLQISYTGNTNLGADTYSDTLTVTITGK